MPSPLNPLTPMPVIDTSFTGWPTSRTLRCSAENGASIRPSPATQIPASVPSPESPEHTLGVIAAGGTSVRALAGERHALRDEQVLRVGAEQDHDPITAACRVDRRLDRLAGADDAGRPASTGARGSSQGCRGDQCARSAGDGTTCSRGVVHRRLRSGPPAMCRRGRGTEALSHRPVIDLSVGRSDRRGHGHDRRSCGRGAEPEAHRRVDVVHRPPSGRPSQVASTPHEAMPIGGPSRYRAGRGSCHWTCARRAGRPGRTGRSVRAQATLVAIGRGMQRNTRPRASRSPIDTWACNGPPPKRSSPGGRVATTSATTMSSNSYTVPM